MSDLISRRDIYEKLIYDTTKTISLGSGTAHVAMWRVANAIKDVPAVDAVPVVHGEWVGTADGYADGELVYDMWECSECGYDADGADEKPSWNYCPNCGAKMDGGNDG